MNCIICNKEIEKSKYSNAILCSSECFHIDFWNSKVEIKNDPNSVRENGTQYYIGTPDGSFKGFGGRRFKITFNDGRVVKTDCLWHNGEIPDEFKDRLPDNAVIEGVEGLIE